jgi:hypothetical protein
VGPLVGLAVPLAGVLAAAGGLVWLALHAATLAAPGGGAPGAGVLDALGSRWPLALLAVWLALVASAAALLTAAPGLRRR